MSSSQVPPVTSQWPRLYWTMLEGLLGTKDALRDPKDFGTWGHPHSAFRLSEWVMIAMIGKIQVHTHCLNFEVIFFVQQNWFAHVCSKYLMQKQTTAVFKNSENWPLSEWQTKRISILQSSTGYYSLVAENCVLASRCKAVETFTTLNSLVTGFFPNGRKSYSKCDPKNHSLVTKGTKIIIWTFHSWRLCVFSPFCRPPEFTGDLLRKRRVTVRFSSKSFKISVPEDPTICWFSFTWAKPPGDAAMQRWWLNQPIQKICSSNGGTSSPN